MPELPEVEIMRRLFEEASLNKPIDGFEIIDEKVYKGNPVDLANSLVNHMLVSTERIGKHLFARTDSGKWILIHFGMTGDLKVLSRSEHFPRFTRFRFLFPEHQLCYTDPRKFGKLESSGSPEEYAKANKLGADMLDIEKPDFIDALKGRKTMVKPALLEQRYFAGIGNWIADEMLFATRIHPEKRLAEITEQQFSLLFDAAIRIMREAIKADTHYGDFPEGMFANLRKEGANCPNGHQESITRLVVGGRGTFICPRCQV